MYNHYGGAPNSLVHSGDEDGVWPNNHQHVRSGRDGFPSPHLPTHGGVKALWDELLPAPMAALSLQAVQKMQMKTLLPELRL